MKKFSEKVEVRIDPPAGLDKADFKPGSMREEFLLAGWSDDPGTGHAVHTVDGREVFNPVPMAPPVGYVEEVSAMDRVQEQINKHLKMLRDADEVDSAEDADDFDMEEEFDPFSLYEFMDMTPEAPALPKEAPAAPEQKAAEPPPDPSAKP